MSPSRLLAQAATVLFAVAMVAIPVAFAGERDRDDCENESDLQKAIAACTRVIEDRSETKDNRADAYYNRGYSYTDLGQYDRAIADFNALLKIFPDDVDAFVERGIAHTRIGAFDKAIDDYNQAIRIEPDDGEPYFQRAVVFAIKGDLVGAIADYTQTIKLDGKDTDAFLSRGIAHFYAGSTGEAQADFKAALELEPDFAYAALWLDIAERRNRLPSRFAELAKRLDGKEWPAPIIRLFRGQSSIAAAIDATKDSRPNDLTLDLCEVHFYAGQWALAQSQKDEAVEHFRFAANRCFRNVVEYYAAREELKALGAGP